MEVRLFAAVAEDFLAHRRIYTDNPRTLRSQMRVLGVAFDALPLAQITPAAVERWMATRLDAGVSRATLNRNRAALSVLFEWAIRAGHHQGVNPVKGLRPFREGPGRTRYLTGDEAARLMLAAAAHLKPVLALALYTGGRLGEVLALRWADVDLQAGVVTYRKETTKARRTRSVPISGALRAVLTGLRRGRPDQPVCHWQEAPLRSVRTAFETARKKAGLGRDVTFHTCRHSFSAWAVQNGLDLYRLQTFLGHSDISLTQRYAHLSREYLEDGVRFIGPPGRVKAPEAEG
jgi:integrase